MKDIIGSWFLLQLKGLFSPVTNKACTRGGGGSGVGQAIFSAYIRADSHDGTAHPVRYVNFSHVNLAGPAKF